MKYLLLSLIFLISCTDPLIRHYKNDSSVISLDSFSVIQVCRNKTIIVIDTCTENVGCYGLSDDSEYIGPFRRNVRENDTIIFCSVISIKSGSNISSYQQETTK